MKDEYTLKAHIEPDGRVVSDEKLPLPPGPVEITVHAHGERRDYRSNGKSVLEVLKALPVGGRTKSEIDAQIREDRDSWERA